jgi:hypothetical protein
MRAVESLRSDRSQVEPIRDSMKRSNRVAEFLRGGIAIALMLGVPTFMIAGISTAFVVEYSVARRTAVEIGLFTDLSTAI